MDEFPGLLSRDFGFRPQGKAAPMSAAKFSSAGSGSVRSPASRSGRSAGDSSLGGGGISGDHRSPDHFDDVFGGPSKPSVPHSRSSFDSLFDGLKDSAGSKPSTMPVYDKPVYDDDIFDGVPGIKSSSFAKYEDVFASSSSASASPPYDDLLQNLGRTMPEPKGSGDTRSGEQKESELSGFDELIPGFGGSSPPPRIPSDTGQRTAAPSVKPTTSTAEDPFVVLETTTTPAYSSPGLFPDPLEHIGRPLSSRSTKASASPVSEGLIDENAFADLTKSVPFFTSDINGNTKDKPPLVTENEPPQRSFIETFESVMPKMQPTRSSGSLKSADRGGVQASDANVATYERSSMEDQSPKSHEHLETADDVWLTVAEIPLFTQPTRAPPPSRPPPPVSIQQAQYGKADEKKKNNDIFSQFSQSRPLMRNSVKKSGAPSIDEFEDFAAGKPQRYADEHAEVSPNGEEIDANTAAAASAAAMKAMDRAEAKFKQAREVRERELDAKSAKNREYTKQERDENAQDPDDNENQERLDFEREQMEREEKVKEQKRREKEREGLDRERGRHAVERATREARERAGADARQRAERAAVEKANAEARQRAERAAVQRAAAEARDRAAAEARVRAEKANAEAREKANAEARERTAAEARDRAAAEARERAEKASAEARERSIAAREKAAAEARERAAVERAAAEARHRAQRAAVDRATAEARERAAAEARERAAASAREKHHKADNDLESFFGMGNRANSAPKQRTTTSENVFEAQFQSKMASDGARRSPGSSYTVRKAPSATNIVDDLTSIFGAPSSSGDFQEVEGESEERRRSRLERHHRTMERAAKALAEKNERDMQVQRDQAERNRIAEDLDLEIRRWAAGKEGNLRALLSTLQYVLWRECEWQPVSLTDLITGASVKLVYRRATLRLHPDKVQQKGATLQQKYIAEKVFDLLKEAWNRFNSEELF